MNKECKECEKSLCPLIICGPSGVGKGTLKNMLREELPKIFTFSVSHTTRKPRGTEKDGIAYHFVTDEFFLEMIPNDFFLEHTKVHGHRYGTSYNEIRRVCDELKMVCILDIDVVGAQNVKSKKEFDPFIVFVLPPSMDELKKRLIDRGTEDEKSIAVRMETTKKEMEFYEKNRELFDVSIVNDDLDECYKEFKSILKKRYKLSI